MIVEVRTYKLKPGYRDEFIRYFLTRGAPAQRALGIKIAGPFLDLEDADVFVFLRAFPSLEERERMKAAFYGSDEWKNELEGIAMPMIDSFQVALVESADLDFTPR